MNRSTSLLRKKALFFLIPILICIVYLGSTVLSSAARQDKNIIKVNNLTQSCELLNVEKHNDHIRVSVQNNSNKAITAFVLTWRTNPRTISGVRVEFAFSEDDSVIPPGQSYDTTIGISDSLNRQTGITLNLSSVIFEDGSSEGDPETIRDTVDSRLGRKIQIMKILPTLDRILRMPDTELGFYWNKTARQDLEAALNAPDRDILLKLNKKLLNNNEPYNESEQFKSGAQVGKETIIRNYEDLKNWQENQEIAALRGRIIELRNLYAKMIARF